MIWIDEVNEVDFEQFVSHYFGVQILGGLFFLQKRNVAYVEFTVKSRLFVELPCVQILGS